MAAVGGRIVYLPRGNPSAVRSISPEELKRGDGETGAEKTYDVSSLRIRNFRRSVIQRDAAAVFEAVQSTLGIEEVSQAELITSLVLKRCTPEPSKEALMIAICIGMRPLVELIISLFYEFPGEEYNGCRHSCAFPPHLTPLMLACMCNNFAIAEFLLLRNHHIQLPHRADCYCEKCCDAAIRPSFAVATLDTYMAISSEAFLWLACRDPILAAFQLATDLEVCSRVDQDYKSTYWQLHENLMAVCLRMVEQCWHMQDVEIVLSQKDGVQLSHCQFQFPRLRVALECHMRTFISAMNIQTALQACWRGDWGDYGNSMAKDVWRLIEHSLLLPLRAPLHIISGGLLMNSFKSPIARYISGLSSYVFFLIVLLIIRLCARGDDRANDRIIKENGRRSETTAILYTSSHSLKMRFDLIFLWFFSGSLFCWVMTTAIISQDGISKLHRRHWVFYDFSLIYDIYFGAACILAFWRVFYFVQLKRYVGSTVISIVRCAQLCFIFLTTMVIVMLSFALGLTTMHQAYKGGTAIGEDGSVLRMKDKFSSVLETLRNLYWSFYGYLGPWEYALAVGNAGPDFKPVNHLFVVIAGEVTVAIYHIVVVVTLLKMMATLLVWRSDEVQDKNDEESSESAIKKRMADEITYQNLLRRLFARCVHSDEFVCRTVQRVDAEKCAETSAVCVSEE
ncbi:unnamed protein product [Toxocara canis]|uniref:TRP_2 domain-containing protein n=1 Tax=Toxocara canis TaxID=6265 RepID=A0A183UWK6_TOXCA|nr:unnamed protein product [Toxocara canis]